MSTSTIKSGNDLCCFRFFLVVFCVFGNKKIVSAVLYINLKKILNITNKTVISVVIYSERAIIPICKK